MAIQFYELFGIESKQISKFIDRDSGQFDPCFAAFKRFDQINAFDDNSDNSIASLQLIDKAEIRIRFLQISEDGLIKMRELFWDKAVGFTFEGLIISYSNKESIPSEVIEIIKKINPKKLRIERIMQNVENIKTVSLLKCTNIQVEFSDRIIRKFNLLFKNIQIQLFDSKPDQMLTFEWKSIRILIDKNKIENLKLLKTNADNFLFIPLDTINRISCSGFREVLDANDIIKQFVDLDVQNQFNTNGLILPVWYLNRIFIRLDDSELNFLNQSKDINQLFKEKQISLTINHLSRLLEIYKLWSGDFSKTNFKYIDKKSIDKSEYSVSEIMNNQDWINLKFREIIQSRKLSPDEFQFWWNVLRSRRTRFYLASISLRFNVLSECLTALSLCSDCPELKSVDLRYSKADEENEVEVVEQAKREFRQKFGFIQKLTIRKL